MSRFLHEEGVLVGPEDPLDRERRYYERELEEETVRKLECREVSGRDCEWEFIGDDDEEVIAKAIAHDERMHGFRPTPEQERQMRAAIHE